MSTPHWPDCVPTLIDTATGVTLRAHRDDDVPRLVEQCRDPESVRWTTPPDPYGVADARAYVGEIVPGGWNDGTTSAWAIEAEIGGRRRYCGSLDVRHPDGSAGEIGYGLHPDARGRGILTAAGRLALDWAFAVRGLRMVRWAAHVGNWPSRYAAAALGFREEGVRRSHLLHRGEPRDCWTASLLPGDPRVSLLPPRQPELTGERVRLRPLAEADLPRIAEAFDDPLTAHWLPEVARPFTPADAEAFLATCREGAFTGSPWTWALTGDDDRLAGGVTLFGATTGHQGELGYWAHPDARGRGLVTDAVRTVAAYALGEGRHQVLTIRCARENAASQAVARAAGFAETGLLPRGERLRDGAYADLVLHARLR